MSRPAWVPFAAAAGLVAIGWLARATLTPIVGPTALPFIFFFPAVVVAAWLGGWKPGAFAMALSVGAAHWFFTERVSSGSAARFTDFIPVGAFAVSCSFILAAIQAMHLANGKARAELTARERAETHLAAIVEHSGDAILTKNLDGIIQTWNASAQLLFGYRADEIVGRPITTLFPPDRLEEEDHILSRLRAGQPVERFETIRMAKDGRRIPVSISISPLRNSEGEVIGASKVVHDITALAAAREELVREKELLATTLASIGDGVVVTDAEGRVTFLNAEAERLTGWTTAEAQGQPLPSVFRIVNEQTRSPVENPVEKVLRLGAAVGLANHTVLIAKDGRETPIDDCAAPIRHGTGPLFGVVLIFRDVVEQRKVEAALRFNEQRARAFLDNSAIIAWLKDEMGRYVFQSENYIRRFEMHDWENRTDAELWPADIAEVFRKNDLAVLSGDTSLEVVEETRTPDGRATHWLSSKFWFQDAAGKKYVGGVGVDITERLRVERTVREREAVLRTVTNESRVALVMVNEQRRYLFANRAYSGILGLPDENIAGQGVSDLPAAIYDQIAPRLDCAFAGERIRHELHIPSHARTGREHFYEVLYEPRLENDSGPYVVVVLVDITERKRAEEALLRSEQHLTLLSNTVPALISYVGPDYRYRSCNRAYSDWFGLPSAEIIGHTMREVLGEAAWKVVGPLMDQAFAGETVHYESRLEYPRGGARWVDAVYTPDHDSAGEVIGVIVFVTDVSGAKRAEQALRESERSLREAQAVAHVGSWEWNAATECSVGSDEVYRIFGLPVGLPMPNFREQDGLLYPHESWMQLNDAIQEALRTGAGYDLEIEALRNGERIWVNLRSEVVRDAAEKITGLRGTVQDITVRKRAEEALRNTAEELARSSRAKDEFLAALSHELRTPLTPVLMTAAALERDPALPADAREQLGMMRHNIELEARLIDDLLDITRISRGKLTLEPVPVDIHQLLHNTAAIVRSDGLDKQVHLELQLQADRRHAVADPARLHQVFWNLLRNAFKFTPVGGSVTVTPENDDAGNILIRVADTGIGIAPEDLARIFNAFEQIENPGQRRADGLGLGLAISRSIVEMHGGEIYAESGGAGLGAAFHVKLASMVETPAPAPPKSYEVPCRPLRLLLVEDHQATLSTLTRLLARDGHHIASATTVREALKVAATGHFDLVVSDLGLPDGSGHELMRQLRRLRPIHGIALSGFGMPDDLRQATDAGFFAHLVKPIDINQLRRLLSRVPGTEEAGSF